MTHTYLKRKQNFKCKLINLLSFISAKFEVKSSNKTQVLVELVETKFLWYVKQTQKKSETHREKTSKRTQVNFRRKNSFYFKFFIIVILLYSEPLPGQVSQKQVT